jgi:hypothetical protein
MTNLGCTSVAALLVPIIEAFSSCCCKSSFPNINIETDDIQFQVVCCSRYTLSNGVADKQRRKIDGAVEASNATEMMDECDGSESSPVEVKIKENKRKNRYKFLCCRCDSDNGDRNTQAS